MDLFGPAQWAEGIWEFKLWRKQFRKRSCQGRTSLSDTDPSHLHKRLCWHHHSGKEERCRPQGLACHQGRLLGLASGYQERPWRRELLGHIQTCRRTAHLPPVFKKKDKRWSYILNETWKTNWIMVKCLNEWFCFITWMLHNMKYLGNTTKSSSTVYKYYAKWPGFYDLK